MQNFYNFFTVALLLHSKKIFKRLMHECLNQVTAWFKNKEKPKKPQTQPRINNYNNKQKIGGKYWFFFLLLYDNWQVL